MSLWRLWKIKRFQKWLEKMTVEGCWESDNCTLCPYGYNGQCLIVGILIDLDLLARSV